MSTPAATPPPPSQHPTILSLSSSISHILSLSIPLALKTKLLQGICDTLRTLLFTSHQTSLLLPSLSLPSTSQQSLWNSIQLLESQILSARKQKQNNENNLDMYFDQFQDIQEILEMKVEILERVEEEIERKMAEKEGRTSTIAESMVSDNMIDNI